MAMAAVVAFDIQDRHANYSTPISCFRASAGRDGLAGAPDNVARAVLK